MKKQDWKKVEDTSLITNAMYLCLGKDAWYPCVLIWDGRGWKTTAGYSHNNPEYIIKITLPK